MVSKFSMTAMCNIKTTHYCNEKYLFLLSFPLCAPTSEIIIVLITTGNMRQKLY